MDKQYKPQQAAGRKTRSNVKWIVIFFLLPGLILSQDGCTRMVIYPGEQTATAMARTEIEAMPTLTVTPEVAVQGGGNTLPEEATPTPTVSIPPTEVVLTPIPASPTSMPTVQKPPILYYTMSGDTLETICTRFNASKDEISSPDLAPIPENTFLPPDKLMIIPDRLENTSSNEKLIPDSEVIFSASTIGFDLEAFVSEAGGYLRDFREYRTDGWYSGAKVIERVAFENSINPRMLLAILEFQSHWVYDQPTNLAEIDYPIGWKQFEFRQLYKQLNWAVQQLSIGYYGWRDGRVTEITFADGKTLRLAPDLNAGTVAVLNLFSRLYDQREFGGVLYSPDGFIALYQRMFGDAWQRVSIIEPLFPVDISQPELILPFEIDKTWNLTSGPHAVWGPDGVMAALDFAPPTQDHGCVLSDEWVTAGAAGVVVRSYNGIVVIDLDGDGYEQTGWVLFYLHLYHVDRITLGTWVNTGDHIGHPSCEGGLATGTHMHIARKFNGEWIPADGPLPFVMDGWQAHQGDGLREGYLQKGDQKVIANLYGSFETKITRVVE